MRSICRWIKIIEEKLNIGNDRTGTFIILIGEGDADKLPEPLEEWITYKEAKAKCGQAGIFLADPEEELKAREEQKATLQKGAIL
ncbi:MAG: hypothetical protein ACYTDW_07185 [Planctomycetota bacterium]|jgi:hypothetical protein